jgi:Fe2+ or Zn2+ uptake regulation protein
MTHSASLNQLRKSGYRLTPQRLAILQVLEETHGHLSAAEIFQAAVHRLPGLTEATVYRTLDFLIGHGLALVAHIGSGRMVYESALHDHHHLICRKCGQSTEIGQVELAALFKHFEKSTGYHIDASHVTFFGLCPDCLDHTQSFDL